MGYFGLDSVVLTDGSIVETLSRELGVTSLIITKVGPNYRIAGTPDGLSVLLLQNDGSF